MKKKDNNKERAKLRRLAETALEASSDEKFDISETSPEGIKRLIHELHVHQIELEMQNDELRRIQGELEASRQRYLDLYDLAPVGYLTMNEKGLILEVNLTAAQLLGVERSALVKQPLSRFILPEDQDIYYRHRKLLFEAGEPRACEMRMQRPGGLSFWARVESAVAKDANGSSVCRAVMSDINDHKRVDEVLREKEDAELRKQTAETALLEIKKLKDQLEAERGYLQEEINLGYNYENIIGQSNGLKYVLHKVEQIAGSNTNVLVLGETGTGKELIARAIHGLGPRKHRALVKVNCAALPSNLIESELFGHEKGAFTGSHSRQIGRFEVADGSTLFLDEIGELPLGLQSKLLRVVQDGEFERLGSSRTTKVDVRIIAATNRNLEEEVRKGGFREDLWYRLAVFPITIPPLRDRREDIPLLVEFYVKKISRRMGKTIEIISKDVMKTLENYNWPGNVRELENVLERAVINSSGPKLRLMDNLNKQPKDVAKPEQTLENVERDYIKSVLEETGWKVSGKNSAAEILGLDRSTLRARMRKLNIQKP